MMGSLLDRVERIYGIILEYNLGLIDFKWCNLGSGEINISFYKICFKVGRDFKSILFK